MKIWNIIISTIGILLAILIFFITREAVVETQNWMLFDIDFSGKEGIISGYGSLLSALLSSLSIFLLVYTILFQSKEVIKQEKRFSEEAIDQEKRFRKQLKLQKKHFKAEKNRNESNENLDLFYKLKLVEIFLGSIISHIEDTGKEVKQFFEKEKANPLNMNMLFFLVNKNMGKLIEMDHLSIYKSFRKFLNKGDEWTKKFSELFNSVGFYKDALEELRDNYKYHNKDKFSRKSKISEDLRVIMNNGVSIIEKYKKTYGEGYLNYPFSNLINNFIPEYYKILEDDSENSRETDLDNLSQNLLLNFIKEAMYIRSKDGFDDLGSAELISLVSSVRKDIAKLKFDCIYFANDCEDRYNTYFSLESKYLKVLIGIKNFISEGIEVIDVEKI